MTARSTRRGVNRYFNGVPTTRLIVTVESALVDEVDNLIKYRGNAPHPCNRNRAEFVRQAIAEKLKRDKGQYCSPV